MEFSYTANRMQNGTATLQYENTPRSLDLPESIQAISFGIGHKHRSVSFLFFLMFIFFLLMYCLSAKK